MDTGPAIGNNGTPAPGAQAAGAGTLPQAAGQAGTMDTATVMSFLTEMRADFNTKITSMGQTVNAMAQTVTSHGSMLQNLDGRLNQTTGGRGSGTPLTRTRPRSLFETLVTEMPNGTENGQGNLNLTPIPPPADMAITAGQNASSAVQLTARRMYKALDPMGDADIERFKDRPEILMSNFDVAIAQCTLVTENKEGPSLRELVPLFKDEPGHWVSQYAVTKGLDARGPAVITDLRAAFQGRFTGEVRSQESIALDELLNRKIVQQFGESVARYSERFQAVARKLPDESETSLCKYYVRGLQPHLAERCCVDKNDDEWTSLAALVKYSLAQDLRVQTVRMMRAQHGHGNTHGHGSKHKHFDKARGHRPMQGNATKDTAHAAMEMDIHGASAAPVVVLQGRMTAKENPYVDGRPMDWETVPRFEYQQSSGKAMMVPSGLRPATECPAYDCKGPLKLKPREKALLAAWFLCPFCRRERHTPDQCAGAQKKQALKRQAEQDAGGPAPKK